MNKINCRVLRTEAECPGRANLSKRIAELREGSDRRDGKGWMNSRGKLRIDSAGLGAQERGLV